MTEGNPLNQPPWTQQAELPRRPDLAPRTFLVTWTDGHAELIDAHEFSTPTDGHPYWLFVWKTGQYERRTVLAAIALQISMVRDVTDGETFDGVMWR